MMGFSFGAWVGLAVGAPDPRVVALVGLGLPTALLDCDFLRDIRKPILIVQGTRDIYGPREQVDGLFKALQKPKRLHWVKGTDHFFTGRLDEVQVAVRDFIQEFVAAL